MAREPRILPYLDMPMQHASDAVLARMRRPERQRTIRERVRTIREVVPDIAIRTTCIVGFPGETDEDFAQLMAFLEEIQFERVGAFTYSPQEGTRAAEMVDDVPESVKRERLERLMELQRQITAERYERFVGRTARAMIDRIVDGEAQARTVWQADDIDGVTYVDGAESLAPGTIVDAVIEGIEDDVDFRASLLRVVDRAGCAARRRVARAPRDERIDRELRAMTAWSRRERRDLASSWRARATLFPGGVSSPVRAFRGVGGEPFVVERGEGARIWDVDGNEYIDYVLSWGPLVLGHAPPVVLDALRETMARGTSFGIPTGLEVELARAGRAADAARRDAALRLERHRGDDERAARRARGDGARPAAQVRRLLSRPRRQLPRARGLRRRDARSAEFARRAGRARGADADGAVQ